MRLDPSPSLIVQPKRIAAHHAIPFKVNQDRMESGLSSAAAHLMSFGPSTTLADFRGRGIPKSLFL
jgi:hypothetical protein